MIDWFLFLSMDSCQWTDGTNSQQVYNKQVGCTTYLPLNVGNRHVDIQRDFSFALVFLCSQSMRAPCSYTKSNEFNTKKTHSVANSSGVFCMRSC